MYASTEAQEKLGLLLTLAKKGDKENYIQFSIAENKQNQNEEIMRESKNKIEEVVPNLENKNEIKQKLGNTNNELAQKSENGNRKIV